MSVHACRWLTGLPLHGEHRQVEQVRSLGSRIDEDAPAQSVAGVVSQNPVGERIEYRLTGMQPHDRHVHFQIRFRPSNTQALARRRRIVFERRKERVESTRPSGRKREMAVEVSPNFEIE